MKLIKGINNDLLTLLAIAVFADKKIFASEIEAFVLIAKKLLNVREENQREIEQSVHKWFDENRLPIQSKLNSRDFEDWFSNLVNRLQEIPNKEEIIEYITEISRADAEEHVSEKALVVLTAQKWGLSLSS